MTVLAVTTTGYGFSIFFVFDDASNHKRNHYEQDD